MGLKKIPANKTILLITGGGNGSVLLNEWLERSSGHPDFKRYFIIHQTGKGWSPSKNVQKNSNYYYADFLGDEMVAVMKQAGLIVCRGGAGTLSEIAALGKSALVVPLAIAQNNEQFHNAVEIQKRCPVEIVLERQIPDVSLFEALSRLKHRSAKKGKILHKPDVDPAQRIWGELRKTIKMIP